MAEITHSELLELIRYDPKTGKMFWIKARPKIRVGDEVGYLHHKGYRACEIRGKQYAIHRLAWFYMTGEWPKDQIDHRNRKRADNRWKNLREATNGQNRANSACKNKTGFKGVRYHPWIKDNPYEAAIRADKIRHYLGCFPTAEAAHEAYKEAAQRLHGEFACMANRVSAAEVSPWS